MGEPGWARRARRGLRKDADALRALLTRPRERRATLRKLKKDPKRVPLHKKRALLYAVLALLVPVWGLGSLALHALAPGLAQPWDLAWWLWAVSFATTVALPIPFEPALFAAQGSAGAAVAVVAAASGKTLGAGAVFFVGGAFRRRLRMWRGRSRWLARFLDATEEAARRWTYLAFGVMMAVPFFPDTIPVYLFSVMGLRVKPFLAASFAGVAVRVALVLLVGRAAGLA